VDDATALNRAHWDAVAAVHGEGDDTYYDVEALRRGESSLRAAERAALTTVGDLAGKDVLHVQCHLGFDSVSLARAGARVTGLDFSSASLDKARRIADQCGVDVSFVEGDSTAVPESLHGQFDVAYATIGVLGWIEDIDAWMRSVASTLRPGGRLVLVELHPLFCMFASLDPLVADFPYAYAGPVVFDEGGTYAAPDAQLAATRTVEFAHSVGEVVTSAVAAGLRVEQLVEHLDADFDPRGDVLTLEDEDRYRLRLGGRPGPVLYTLVAARPG
jgi:2-polyprenyl-3-methyl-5-hydroxy-6-metoxy-1,4-benzoquinol methylase